MRIKALWECPDQDEEVRAKHITNIERFQQASCEPIPPLANECGELIDLDDDLREDPMIASLSGVDTTVVLCEKRSQGDEVENYVDTLVIM